MKILVTGAALAFGLALAAPAAATPGQCSVTGYDTFDCDVDVDGGGLTFTLPDGQIFVFAHEADGAGLGYLLPSDAQPGSRPEELGAFLPVDGKPGCWFGAEDDIEICASLSQ
jgi:hypothetical protein